MKKEKKVISLSSYYSLLFIFVQLDLDIENIKDEKLKRVYEYVNAMMNQTQISRELLLDPFEDTSEINLLGCRNDLENDEIAITLHQLFLTHHPYKSQETNIKTIEKIRTYAFDPLYADVLLGKMLLFMGNYERFKEIVIKVAKNTTDTKAPILKIWKNFFVLLNKYIENPNKKDIVTELKKLAIYCKENNFIKMSEEIEMYHGFISTTRTISQFSDKIKQAAFMDILDYQSKKMVLESLENK